MIKKQHFVALTASLVLVLSGCETTDSMIGGVPVAEEENTVIELVGPNSKSGSIKLPTSDTEESGDGADSENPEKGSDESGNEDSENQNAENQEEKDSENKGESGNEPEGPSKNVADEDSESGEESSDAESEKTDGESTDKTDQAAEDTSKEDENQKSDDSTEKVDESTEGTSKEDETEKTDQSSDETTEKTDEESTGKTDQAAEDTSKEDENQKSDDSTEKVDESTEGTSKEDETEKTDQSSDETTEKTDEESTGKTDQAAEDTSKEENQKSDESTEGTSKEDETEKTDQSSDESTEKTDEDTTDKAEESKDESTGKTDEKSETPADGASKSETSDTDAEKTDKTEEQTVPEKDYSTNNKILMQKVEAARNAAIDAGASSAAPTVWAATEAIYNTEKSAVETGTKADLSTVLNDLIQRYQGLENLAQAKDLKEEIDENNFASFRQATYNAGAEILNNLTNPLSVVQSGADFNKQAATAESDFRLVLRTAYNSLAQNERTAAYEAKLKADSVKAYVSRKDEYTHAVSLYRNGELRRAVDPKLANDSYKLSKEEFLTLYDEISAARAQAQKEIDEAKKSVAQSATVAVQADAEAPLGDTPVEGIEAEDAKLLEDDDFSNAEQAADIEAPVDEQ